MARNRRRTRALHKADTRAAAQTEAVFTPAQAVAIAEALASKTPVNGGQVTALPRNPGMMQIPFSPGVPLVPSAINSPRPDSGRAEPRSYEFPITANLPGSNEKLVPWPVLRQAADGISIFRKCIEIRKNEFSSLDWDIVVSKKAVARELRAAGGGTPRAELEQQMQAKLAPEIARLSAWWEEPDRRNGNSWIEWIKKALEERFVLDALAIYPRHTYAGDLYSFEILDGSTIKPLLDEHGGRPMPPSPAYQQILWGFPRGEFVADLGEDGLPTGVYPADQLIYEVDNVRSWTPYGYSAVERALTDGALEVQRKAWLMATYTDGVMPSGWLKAGEGQAEWSTAQLAEMERDLNDYYAGITAARQRLRILPWGMEPVETANEAEKYKPDFDLYLLKLNAGHFETTIAELGFTEQGGLGSTGWHEGQADVQDRKATRPTVAYVEALINKLSRRHLGMPAELEIKFAGNEAEDEELADKIGSAQYANARKTLNEERDRTGQARYNFEEADKPFIVTGTGIVFIEGQLEQQRAAAEQAAAIANAKANPPALGDDGGSGQPGGHGDGPTKPKPGDDQGQPLDKADDTGDAELVKTEVAAYTRWARKNPAPRRPFQFEHATPADFDSPDPATMAFDEWVWEAALSKGDFNAWNAANPLHPKGPDGKFRKRGLGELVEHLTGKHGADRSKWPARHRRNVAAMEEAEGGKAGHDNVTRWDAEVDIPAQGERKPRKATAASAAQAELDDAVAALDAIDAQREAERAARGGLVTPQTKDRRVEAAKRVMRAQAALQAEGDADPPKVHAPAANPHQAEIDRGERRHAVADVASEIEELVENEADPAEIRRRVSAAAHRQHGKAGAAELESVAASLDQADGHDEMLRIAREFAGQHGLTRVGDAGTHTAYDPATMKPIGANRHKRGDRVFVARPGYTAEVENPVTRQVHGDGPQTVPVRRAVVDEPMSEAEEAAYRAASTRASKPAIDIRQGEASLREEIDFQERKAGEPRVLEGVRSPGEQRRLAGEAVRERLRRDREAERAKEAVVATPEPAPVAEPAAPARPAGSQAAADQARRYLDVATSREEAARRIDAMLLTGPQLKQLARDLDVPVRSKDTKSSVRDRIVQQMVGTRLTSHAIFPGERGRAEPAPVHRPTAPEPTVHEPGAEVLTPAQQRAAARAERLAARGGGPKKRFEDMTEDELRAQSEARRARQQASGDAQRAANGGETDWERSMRRHSEADKRSGDAEYRRVETALDAEQRTLTVKQREIADVEAKIADAEASGSDSGARYERLVDAREALQQDIDDLDAKMTPMRSRLEALKRGDVRKADEPSDPKVPPPDQRWPAWAVDEQLAQAYTAAIATALAAGLTTTAALDLAQRWLESGLSGTAAATRWLEGQGIHVAERLAGPLSNLHTEAVAAGTRSAQAVTAAARPIELGVSLTADWGSWTPGDVDAARQILSADGHEVLLQGLLDRFGITVKSIADRRLDELAAILADGLEHGRTPDEIAQAITALTGDRAKAYRIAITETARALSASAVEQYEQDGITTKGWMNAADQDVCQLCRDNEDAGDIPLDALFPSLVPYPPAHPHCRCAIVPGVEA